jgi:nitrite reductase (cytochrome c-552)
MIAEMGWETFNKTPYNELKDRPAHRDSSCADCHDPETMELRITRPAFINAWTDRGIDWTQASRQEMRTYVCAQCHVEYYFLGDNKVLTFPWSQGLHRRHRITTTNMVQDWTHAETNAPMIKIQHPEFEMWTSGLHAKSGVALRRLPHALRARGGDQGVGSLAAQPAGQRQRRLPDLPPPGRVAPDRAHQHHSGSHRRAAALDEEALIDAIDAIVAAQNAGATDEELANARYLHRRASLRWDFVSSENSTGFHSPQEAGPRPGDGHRLRPPGATLRAANHG